MTTFIVGAHGQIGQLTTKALAATGEKVVAGIRDQQQAATLSALGAQPQAFDLASLPAEQAIAFEGVDNVVFTAGSGGNTGYDGTLQIDLDGAIKTMIAAEQAGVKRYVIVSALYAEQRDKWAQTGIAPYYVAKYYADEWLQHRTQLDYTILRPGVLTNAVGTGKIDLQPAAAKVKKIPRADVAAAIVAVLKQPQTYKRVYDLVSGTTDVNTAFA
ncbi:SDR family oxidoreductase [Loigolactobacillus binensis]|uniref:SDR family oxidoreductase n=1 Tax=Loigolactobacillus binensis TaxID=2559922 RepID=A0ABW3EDQ8_9LACO|nr:SDR family oxidoreductase [Loigolactobacillus binensis]